MILPGIGIALEKVDTRGADLARERGEQYLRRLGWTVDRVGGTSRQACRGDSSDPSSGDWLNFRRRHACIAHVTAPCSVTLVAITVFWQWRRRPDGQR